MEFNLEIGLTGTKESMVSDHNTAVSYGSGALDVFATPAMIGLMEGAAMIAIQEHLPNDYGTVGTLVNIKHTAATPVGMKVSATAELVEINGKRLTFKVKAHDEKELIGEGIHERYIVNNQRFLTKSSEKLK